jgi:hypothetical protein
VSSGLGSRVWLGGLAVAILAALPTIAHAQAKPPVPPKPVTTKPALQTKKPAVPPKLVRFSVGGGIGMSATSNDFDQDVPFELYAEQATISGPVSVSRGPRFEASAGYRIWRRFGAGATFTLFKNSGDMQAVFQLPHPFVFGAPREAIGDTSATRTTMDLHVSGLVGLVAGPRWHVVAYAGPSFTWLSQELGYDRFSYTYVVPFNEATLSEMAGSSSKGDGIGAHAGVSMTRMMGRRWGILGDFRGSSTKAKLDALGTPVELQTGGFQVSAGVRVHF